METAVAGLQSGSVEQRKVGGRHSEHRLLSSPLGSLTARALLLLIVRHEKGGKRASGSEAEMLHWLEGEESTGGHER